MAPSKTDEPGKLPSEGGKPGTVWLILIGINAYPAPINSLLGCVRDVETAESVLTNAFAGSDVEIIKITANAVGCPNPPTYDNIVEKINHVQQHVKKNDIVYFHYSGHGGRQLRNLVDENMRPPLPDSPDHYLECLVLHGGRHMPDHELGNLFDGLADAGAKLFVVLDCCHSGGGDRVSNRAFVRQIDHVLPADPRSKEPEETAQVVVGNGRSGNEELSYWTRPRKYALLAACHPNQFAMEYLDRQSRRRGALTTTLLTSLEKYRQNGQTLNYKSLFWDVNAQIRSYVSGQYPKLFCSPELMDSQVFFHDSLATTRQATVTKVDDGRVYIDQGHIQGVKEGEKWAIWPRGILRPTPDSRITTVTIDEVEGIQSSGLLDHGVQGVDGGCAASLESAVYGEDLHVVVQDATLRQQLADMPSIGVKFHDVDYEGARYKIMPTGDQGHHQIVDGEMPVSGLPEESTAENLHRSMKRLAHYMRVLNLRNNTSEDDLGEDFTFQVAGNPTTVRSGSNIKLQMTNRRPLTNATDPYEVEPATLYYSVLNLRSDKTVTLVLPGKDNRGHCMTMDPGPGTRTTTQPIRMKIDASDGDATEITDIFKIIVADQPISLGTLASADALRGSAGSATQGDFDQDFRHMLKRVESGARGGEALPAPAKWQTAHVTVKVVR